MLTLATKDGARSGNAIIYGSYDDENGTTFLVETDFGNRMKLSWKEIEELFTPIRCCPYDVWNADRHSLREANYAKEIEKAFPSGIADMPN